MPLEADSSNLAEQRSYLQSFKAPLLEGECLGIIVSVVTEPLSAHPDMGEEDAQTVNVRTRDNVVHGAMELDVLVECIRKERDGREKASGLHAARAAAEMARASL